MYHHEEVDAEAKATPPGAFTCTVDTGKFRLAILKAEKEIRRFGQNMRELRDAIHTPKSPRFYNPLGVDEVRWRRMNRAERRKFIKKKKLAEMKRKQPVKKLI